jgi:hypothetical protein
MLFDGDGKQLLGEEARKTFPVRVDAWSVLLFSAAPTSGSTNVALTGVNLSGKRTPLGSLEDVHAGACSWNKEFLTCPAEDGFRAWRFTA